MNNQCTTFAMVCKTKVVNIFSKYNFLNIYFVKIQIDLT